MPNLKQPESLYNKSLHVFVEKFVSQWIAYYKDVPDMSVFSRILQDNFPYFVANDAICGIITRYVEYYERNNVSCTPVSMPNVASLIKVVCVPQLTSLDLQRLIVINVLQESEFLYFEESVLQSLPVLCNIVELSLSTHGVHVTLPICSDNILREIGNHCKKLKKLNVSFNTLVTDAGLNSLTPVPDDERCSLLEELFVNECSVTSSGVCHVLENLPKLRIVWYKGIVDVLFLLHAKIRKERGEVSNSGLMLTHLSNVGGPRKHVHIRSLVEVARALCPSLTHLKIRLFDSEAPLLEVLPNLSTLEMIYNLGKQSSPSSGTYNYLSNCGKYLSNLTLKCDNFITEHFAHVGKYCPNIRNLWVKCHYMTCNLELESRPSKEEFFYLEILYIHVGEAEWSECMLPVWILQYILKNTSSLKELKVIARSTLITDVWLNQLWKCVSTNHLEKLVIALPGRNHEDGVLQLSLLSANTILQSCPNLHTLGNLLVWEVTYTEYEHLQAQSKEGNLDLQVIYRFMRVT